MLKQNRAIELRLYPNKEQQVLLNKTFGCVRKVYNLALAECIELYQETKLFKHSGYPTYVEQYDYLNEVEKQALCQSLNDLNIAFKNRFSKTSKKQSGFPKFKSKKSRQSYRTCQPSKNALGEHTLKLPKIGKVRFRAKPKVGADWKLKSITISMSATGKYHASLLYEFYVEEPIKVLDVNNSIGLDYSSHDFYVDNQGIRANYPKFYRVYEHKLAKEQRKLSHCKKGSNNYYKQKHKVALVHEKITNCRKDFCHKLARQLSNQYDYIFVEDVDLKAISQALKLGKSTLDNGFGMFRNILNYKLSEQGKRLIVIDKWTPTSTACSNCGAYHKDIVNSLAIREWICPDCGAKHNRDVNAAKNIRSVGIKTVGTTGLACVC